MEVQKNFSDFIEVHLPVKVEWEELHLSDRNIEQSRRLFRDGRCFREVVHLTSGTFVASHTFITGEWLSAALFSYTGDYLDLRSTW